MVKKGPKHPYVINEQPLTDLEDRILKLRQEANDAKSQKLEAIKPNMIRRTPIPTRWQLRGYSLIT